MQIYENMRADGLGKDQMGSIRQLTIYILFDLTASPLYLIPVSDWLPYDWAPAGDLHLCVDHLDHRDRARPAEVDRRVGAGEPRGHGKGRCDHSCNLVHRYRHG
jgi:hypothetical protein